MGDINAVATAIGSRLEDLLAGISVYPGQSPDTLPRCVYEISSAGFEGQREEIDLRIEIATQGTDTVELDEACAAIRGNGDPAAPSGLDHYIYSSDPAGTQFCVYFIGESPVPPDAEAVRQRALSFNITAYYI